MRVRCNLSMSLITFNALCIVFASGHFQHDKRFNQLRCWADCCLCLASAVVCPKIWCVIYWRDRSQDVFSWSINQVIHVKDWMCCEGMIMNNEVWNVQRLVLLTLVSKDAFLPKQFTNCPFCNRWLFLSKALPTTTASFCFVASVVGFHTSWSYVSSHLRN